MSEWKSDSAEGPGRRISRPARPWDTDRAARDRVYTASTCVADIGIYLRQYAERSAQARKLLPWRAVRYGADSAEVLHFFPANQRGAPLHVFVHGGFWQELSEEESSFAAPDLIFQGAAFAALGYGLAPHHRLDDIVAMVRRSVLWLYHHAAELGVDQRQIFLSGSSAGAHLVAMCLLEGWLPDGLRPRDIIGGATLLSGLYELEQLQQTYIGEAMGLGIQEAVRNSPIRYLRPGLPALIVARGVVETEVFVDQHDDLVSMMRQLGVSVSDLVVAGRNHYDLPLGLGDPRDVLGRAVLTQMGLYPAADTERT